MTVAPLLAWVETDPVSESVPEPDVLLTDALPVLPGAATNSASASPCVTVPVTRPVRAVALRDTEEAARSPVAVAVATEAAPTAPLAETAPAATSPDAVAVPLVVALADWTAVVLEEEPSRFF